MGNCSVRGGEEGGDSHEATEREVVPTGHLTDAPVLMLDSGKLTSFAGCACACVWVRDQLTLRPFKSACYGSHMGAKGDLDSSRK